MSLSGRIEAQLASGGEHGYTSSMNNHAPTLLLLAASVVAASEDGLPMFKITTKKRDDTVEVRGDKDKVTFTVKSPSGISQGVIERQGETWPKAVVLRLHLKGLESFRVSSGKVRLDAAVSIQEGKPKVRLWKDGKEAAPLDEKSPFWADIRIVGGDAKPAKELPLKDGYFGITLPRELFDGNPKTITVGWIDFFRN
jgi:hypothetical protein